MGFVNFLLEIFGVIFFHLKMREKFSSEVQNGIQQCDKL
jgi:hypothetical protein